jgi:hypothetical protein
MLFNTASGGDGLLIIKKTVGRGNSEYGPSAVSNCSVLKPEEKL